MAVARMERSDIRDRPPRISPRPRRAPADSPRGAPGSREARRRRRPQSRRHCGACARVRSELCAAACSCHDPDRHSNSGIPCAARDASSCDGRLGGSFPCWDLAIRATRSRRRVQPRQARRNSVANDGAVLADRFTAARLCEMAQKPAWGSCSRRKGQGVVARMERSDIRDRRPRISRSLSSGSPKARPVGSMRATRHVPTRRLPPRTSPA
jgi:hypothetical protein